jgi:hypothetical protein
LLFPQARNGKDAEARPSALASGPVGTLDAGHGDTGFTVHARLPVGRGQA